MTITSKNFSLDFMSRYLIYDYVEDKGAMVKNDVLVMSLSSSMYLPKIADNGISLQIGMSVSRMFTSDDMLLTSNDSITIDTHIVTEFHRVFEEVEDRQDFIEHCKFMGKTITINLPFKCETSSMEYGLEVFLNNDVDYINIKREPQYYSVLTITLLSTKKRGRCW